MNALAYAYITQSPKVNTSKLHELQLSIDWWQRMYSEAGEQKEIAWCMYSEAIDNKQPRHIINDLCATAQLFDDICRDTWAEWQQAKRNLLDLLS